MDLIKQAIEIVDKMQALGFPNVQNINALEAKALELEKLSSHFETVHQVSIQQIKEVVERIKDHLDRHEEIPVKMYSSLNAQLILLKKNLISSS